jgi:UDP-glucose 4-epimerase
MQILVTGGSGFIGTQVVRKLQARGDDVTVIDLNPSSDPDVSCVVGDICDPDALARALPEGTEAVVHLAAITSVLKSVEDPDGIFRTNVIGTQRILERCREIGTKRLVFASSNAVVGDVGAETISEQSQLRPLTPYGSTKASCEMLLWSYAASYGMQTAALRYTNVYGVGMQAKDSVVARLMRAALGGDAVPIYGDGEQRRDYIFVADAVSSVEVGLGVGGAEVMTVGAGRSVSMNELHTLASEVVGFEIPVTASPAKPGEMPAVIVDTSHARSLGFEAEYDLSAGLVATWKDFQASGA